MRKIYIAIIFISLLTSIFGCSSVLEINASVNIEEAGEVMGTGQFERNSIVSLRAEANKGYEFIRWEYDGEVISKENPLVIPLEKRRTLEAIFQKKEYTINASSQDPQKGIVVGSGLYQYEEKVSLEARAKDGFKFIGWEGLNSKEEELEFLATKELRLVAHFIEYKENLIDEEFLVPSVSVNNEMLAYMFENVLSIFSLKNQKALADFSFLNVTSSKAEKVQHSIKWLEDGKAVVLYYNNNLFLQSLDGEKKIISSRNVFKYNTDKNLVGFIEYENEENVYKAIAKIIDLESLETKVNYSTEISELSQLDKYLLNLERNILIYPADKILNLVSFEDGEVKEISFKDKIKEVELINNQIIAVVFDNEIVLINLNNHDSITTKDIKPSEHYIQSDYYIAEDSMVIKYRQNSQSVYYLFELKEFENIITQKIFDLPDGDLIDLINENNLILLQIDKSVYQIQNGVAKYLMRDDISKTLTLVNGHIFYIIDYSPGYYGGLKYKEIESEE